MGRPSLPAPPIDVMARVPIVSEEFLEPIIINRKPMKLCTMTGCERPIEAQGVCHLHYLRAWRADRKKRMEKYKQRRDHPETIPPPPDFTGELERAMGIKPKMGE